MNIVSKMVGVKIRGGGDVNGAGFPSVGGIFAQALGSNGDVEYPSFGL